MRARRLVADAKQAIARTNAAIARLNPVPEQNPVPPATPRANRVGKVPVRPARRPA